MKLRAFLLLLIGLALGTPLHADLPTVEITKIFEDNAGGSLTLASQVQIDGKRVFLKSNKGSARGTRYANFESDILAKRIFEKVGIRCPDARMVRIGSSPKREYGGSLEKYLGQEALAMEFVNTRFTSGRVYRGVWPEGDRADVAKFIDLFLVDLIIGNADRRDANLFVGVRYGTNQDQEGPGSNFPIPIDNNSGFGSMVVYPSPSPQGNFLKTFDGVGKLDISGDLGTIRNIILDSHVHRTLVGRKDLRPRVLARAAQIGKLLDDAFIDGIVAELPREVIPRGVKMDPTAGAWLTDYTAAQRELLFGGQQVALSGQELFRYRKQELSECFKWRRDHVAAALEKFFATEADSR